MTENGKKMLKQGEVCTECWAWGSVFGLLGVGVFYYDYRSSRSVGMGVGAFFYLFFTSFGV